jgi:hypothetical protein
MGVPVLGVRLTENAPPIMIRHLFLSSVGNFMPPKQFSNRPNVIRQTRFHRRSNEQRRMITAEIVISEVESESGVHA